MHMIKMRLSMASNHLTHLKTSRGYFFRDRNWILFALLQIDMLQLKHYFTNDIISGVAIEAKYNEMQGQGLK